MAEIKHILFPVSLQPISAEIAPHVAYRAEKFGAKVTLLHIAPSTQVLADYYHINPGLVVEQQKLINEAQHLLTEFRSSHLPDATEKVDVGDAADRILNFVERNQVDMIIMGTHGRTGLERLAIGSVAEKVVRRSPVPVLVINPYSIKT